jgi:DNA-binding XRE family transcriptional regulator
MAVGDDFADVRHGSALSITWGTEFWFRPSAALTAGAGSLYLYNKMPPRPSAEVKIYNRIAVLRAERGLSRAALAEALGINYQTVGYLERGEYNPSLDLAMKIAEHFGLPLDAVFARTPFTPMSAALYGDRSEHAERG